MDETAERERAATDGRPYAVVEECELQWSIGAPLPTVIQWEGGAQLFFYLRGDGDVAGSIVFKHCAASRFGPPGEVGHELAGRGWQPYTPLRVINSAWLRKTFGISTDLSHFVFPFHDSTFECLAHSFRASRLSGPISEGVKAAVDRWE